MFPIPPAARTTVLVASLIVAGALPVSAQGGGTLRALAPGDVYRLRSVSDPQLSPDGEWVAYTVSAADSAKDKNDSNIWMTSWDGTQTVQLTATAESENSPRFSPDGRYLAFLSGREEGHGSQVWLLDRRGGEAQRITTLKDGVDAMVWAPDSKRLALVASIEADSAKADTTRKRPVVVDRYLWKRDADGYLTTSNSHLLLLDIASKNVDTLTTGPDDDDQPRWSPDGSRLAFVRTPRPEPGAGAGADVFVVDAMPGAVPRRLTTSTGREEGPPAWSPDGRLVAFLTNDEPKYYAYQLSRLAVVQSDGAASGRVLTAALDRPVTAPTFSADGRSIVVLTADDRAGYLLRVDVASGATTAVAKGRHVVQDYTVGGADGSRVAVLLTRPDRPAEVFAVDGNAERQLSRQNDSLLAGVEVSPTEDLTSRSRDGTEVHSILVRPRTVSAGSRAPMVLVIHGGPNGQSDYGFSLERQVLAANGYVVLSPNYRGSNGRGLAFQRAIYADWGNKEVQDILGAADEAVRAGIADPQRLGIGGWSYGGILTDYTIATTTRFRAAVSGAGSALQLSMYGTDQYISQYELEVGAPWKAGALWLKLSYPFFKADRIRTPTLFLGGALDFNVPIIGGEQMYQALRTLGVPTQLVIYPGQYHRLTRPGFVRDRLERYVGWYDRFLKPSTAAAVIPQ